MLSSCFFANKRQCAKAQLNKPQRCARAYCVYFEMPKMHLGYVEQAATECGIPHMPIHSGAGHDAQFASYMLPTTMIFVQSKDGLSHCEPEFSSVKHCTEGATVMLNAVLKADKD